LVLTMKIVNLHNPLTLSSQHPAAQPKPYFSLKKGYLLSFTSVI
jgi:hypothetical protein